MNNEYLDILLRSGFSHEPDRDVWCRKESDGSKTHVSSEALEQDPATALRELHLLEDRFEPIGDRLLVLLDKAPEVTESGIHLPEVRKDRYARQGRVLAVGPGIWTEAGARSELQVNVGHTVALSTNAGVPIELSGYESGSLRCMFEREILGILHAS